MKPPSDEAGRADCPQSADDETRRVEGNAPYQSADSAAGRADCPQSAADAAAPAEPDWKDLYARLLADFDNFKKRTARDREDTYRYAEADILRDVLPAVDNLALALSTAKDADDPFVKGVRLVYDTFLNSLKNHGAEPFDSVGQPLDTEKMEAIAQLPSAEVAEGLVSNEVKRGWTLKGKVLRAAQVVVSAGPGRADCPQSADGRAVSMKPPSADDAGRADCPQSADDGEGDAGRADCPQSAAGDESRRVEGNAPYQAASPQEP